MAYPELASDSKEAMSSSCGGLRTFDEMNPSLQYIRDNFPLDNGQVNQIIKNTRLATEIPQDTCSPGKLHFDLDAPKDFFLTGNVTVSDI